MIKAIFFDFDGVLTTEESGAFSTCKILQEKTGVPYKIIYKHYQKVFEGKDLKSGIITPKKWEEACERIGTKIPFSMLQYAMGHPPKNIQMIDLIHQLKPDYKIGLITDNPSERVELLKKVFKFKELFTTVTVSAEVQEMKTSQKIFDIAITDMGVDAHESIFIDNRKENLVIPEEMGFKTCFYDYKSNDIDTLKNKLMLFGVKI